MPDADVGWQLANMGAPKTVVEVGTPIARCPPHRSRRAVFPHRALHVNSLSHMPLEMSPAAESQRAVDRNSVSFGKALRRVVSPKCTVPALGNVAAAGRIPATLDSAVDSSGSAI